MKMPLNVCIGFCESLVPPIERGCWPIQLNMSVSVSVSGGGIDWCFVFGSLNMQVELCRLDNLGDLNQNVSGKNVGMSRCGIDWCFGLGSLTMQVELCRLDNLGDLNQSVPYVHDRLLDWLDNVTVQYGFDGYRVDTVCLVMLTSCSSFMERNVHTNRKAC